MKKDFLAPNQKCAKRKIKRSIENNLNTQTRVNRSTYLKTVLRNQVFSNDRDELLQMMADSIGFENFERWITSFLLIFKPKFLYARGGSTKVQLRQILSGRSRYNSDGSSYIYSINSLLPPFESWLHRTSFLPHKQYFWYGEQVESHSHFIIYLLENVLWIILAYIRY